MTYEPDSVEIAALRAQLAKANSELAQCRHVLKEHGVRGVQNLRASLASFRERLMQILCVGLGREDLRFIELAFAAIDAHVAVVIRPLESEQCACGEQPSLEEVVEEAKALRERAARLFEAAGGKPMGKVLSLGVRVRPPRSYSQTAGEPLRPDDPPPKGVA